MADTKMPLNLEERIAMFSGALGIACEGSQVDGLAAMEGADDAKNKMVSYYIANFFVLQVAYNKMTALLDLNFTGDNVQLSDEFREKGNGVSIPNLPQFFPRIHQMLKTQLEERFTQDAEKENIAKMVEQTWADYDRVTVLQGIDDALEYIAELDVVELERANGLIPIEDVVSALDAGAQSPTFKK